MILSERARRHLNSFPLFLCTEETVLNLLSLLRSELSPSVQDFDIQLLSSLDDGLADLDGDRFSDFSSNSSVVHEEHLQIFDIRDRELLESVGENISMLSIGTVTNRNQRDIVSESPSDSGVNTLRTTPFKRHALISVAVMTKEGFKALVHDLGFSQSLHHCVIRECPSAVFLTTTSSQGYRNPWL